MRLVVLFIALSAAVFAQPQMPNPKEMSGIPRPDPQVAAGTLSVRVIRGSFDKNLTGQPVEFSIGGKTRTVKTDSNGRAEISGLKAGTEVKASTTVDGERLESQLITMETSGVRVLLVATDPEQAKREAENRRLATSAPVKGVVALGEESRVVLQLDNERLRVFYVVEIVNSARTPVDAGGPLIIELPPEARGAALLEGSTTQATVVSARVTVTGPFAPGSTMLQIGYEMPFIGEHVRISQTWPVMLPQVLVLMPRSGSADIQSAQFAGKRDMNDQGQTVVVARGPALAANQPLVIDVTGLPHRSPWPRYVALGLAGGIMSVGIWAAIMAPSRRRRT